MPDLPLLMFHYVDAANLGGVERDGLLSTNELLRRGDFGIAVESAVRAHRPHGITLPSGAYVRDQAPMPPAALARCLDAGISPDDWYDLMNDHVFFWLAPERARRHAAALRRRAQYLLTIDVGSLVAAYANESYVTPFNVGNARRSPARRGARTLVRLASWRESAWSSEAAPGGAVRASSHPPAELLVRGAVPDIATYIRRVERIDPR